MSEERRKGGKREKAGRKPGIPNMLTQALREKIDAERLIKFLQDVADGVFPEATLGERLSAATALLKKVLADRREPQEVQVPVEHVFRLEEYRPKKSVGNEAS